MTTEEEEVQRQTMIRENDEIVMENLNRITRQDPTHLTKEDRDYLCARFSYLTNEQKQTYKDIFLQRQEEVRLEQEQDSPKSLSQEKREEIQTKKV